MSQDAAETGTDAVDATDALPGPTGLPFVGSTFSVARAGRRFSESLAEYGDVVSYRAFGTEFVAIYDPDIVRQVLVERSDEFRKGDFEAAFGELLAPDGLAFTEGEQWREQRTRLQPAFRPNAVQSYAASMVDTASTWTDARADGEVVELNEAASTLTLRMLTQTLFDLDLDARRGRIVREAVDAIADYTDALGVLSVLPDWLPSRTQRRLDDRMSVLDELVAELIADARRNLDSDTATAADDLLSSILRAAPDSSTWDEGEVRDQLVTFLFAGHETTATALTYAIWLLAGSPEARTQLDAELDAVLESGKNPRAATVSELEFTDAIISEAMRLYPPVYSIYRQPNEDVRLGGYRIPEDVTLQLATYNIHRDERWWNNPAEFRPDRWLDDETARPEYAYFPFGGGPRHCIGMRFARMELALILATLSRRLEFERVTEALDPSMRLTLHPGTVEVRVRKRPRN